MSKGRSPGRTWRAVGVATFVLILAVYAINVKIDFGYIGDHATVNVDEGTLELWLMRPPRSSLIARGFWWMSAQPQIKLLPRFYNFGVGQGLFISLWMPLLLAAGLCVLSWRRLRPLPRNFCPTCGYSLIGLAPSTTRPASDLI